MITLDALVGVNSYICYRDNEPSRVINEDNLLSALSIQQWYDDDFMLASALVRSITISHGFQDGNKRTAALVGNIVCPYTCTEDEMIDCILSIAKGEIRDVEEIATILYPDRFEE